MVADRSGASRTTSRGTTKSDDAHLLAERAPGLLARLQVLTGVLAGALSEGDVARVLVDHGVEALGATAGLVAIDDGRGSLRIAASRGYPDEMIDRWREIPGDAPIPIADSIRARRPVFILSLEERDRLYPALANEPTTNHAFLVVPFLLEESTLGALALSFAEPNALLDVDKTFVLAIAQQAAVAIDNARLMAGERAARAQAEKVRDRLSFLSEVSGVLAKSLDHRDAIAELGALTAGRLADWCAIDLVSESGTIERLVARHADPVALTPVEEQAVDWPIDPELPAGSPAVIRSGRPELYPEISTDFADHISQDPTELEILHSIGITSALIVPIQARGRTLGAMTLVSTREDHHYDADDLDFAMLVALRAGVTIDNARLYVEARRSEENSRFQRLLLESQTEATIDGIRVVSADGHILFVNRKWREMWGFGEEDLTGVHEDDVLRQMVEMVEDPEPFVGRVRWLYENPEETARDEVRLKDGRIFDRWSAPLVTEGVTYGRAWYQRDVTAERQLEARLMAAERRSAFLADVSSVLAAARDERTLFDELASRIVPFLADWCVVDVIQRDGTYDRVAVAHRDPAKVELASRVSLRRHYVVDPNAQRGVPKVLRTGATDHAFSIPDEWIDEVGAQDPEYLDVLKNLGFRSYIAVPLNARGRVLGAVTLIAAESDRTYTQEDVTLAEDIARRASIALENVRLLAERSSTARSLQESLLPTALPMIPGVSLAARFRAAGEGNDVGGDFYDVFPAASGGWAVVVGDVCGKGPEAAVLTALVRYTIRTLSMQIRKPRRILARLNDAILSQRNDGRFCTLAYARLDVDAADAVSLRLSSGGHPLPILIRRNGEVRIIGRTGTLLGVFEDAVSPETSVALEPGDAVLFYTDGVIEARSNDEVFGERRLLEILRACGGADASSIAQLVDQSVRDFQAGDQRDDIAVLVVQAVAS